MLKEFKHIPLKILPAALKVARQYGCGVCANILLLDVSDHRVEMNVSINDKSSKVVKQQEAY
jgi:hypothetical protein